MDLTSGNAIRDESHNVFLLDFDVELDSDSLFGSLYNENLDNFKKSRLNESTKVQ